MDLGACPKSHTERLKTEFLADLEANPNDPTFARFQMEYESNIFAFVDECDRRIRTAQRRLEKTPEENAKTTNLVGFSTCFGLLTVMCCRSSRVPYWIVGTCGMVMEVGRRFEVDADFTSFLFW